MYMTGNYELKYSHGEMKVVDKICTATSRQYVSISDVDNDRSHLTMDIIEGIASKIRSNIKQSTSPYFQPSNTTLIITRVENFLFIKLTITLSVVIVLMYNTPRPY